MRHVYVSHVSVKCMCHLCVSCVCVTCVCHMCVSYVCVMCMCHVYVSGVWVCHMCVVCVVRQGSWIRSLPFGRPFGKATPAIVLILLTHMGYQEEAGFLETRLECEVSACEDHGLKPSMPRGHKNANCANRAR